MAHSLILHLVSCYLIFLRSIQNAYWRELYTGKSYDPWSELINKVIEIAKEYYTPRSYSKVYGTNRNKVISFIKNIDLEYPHEFLSYSFKLEFISI